MARDICNHVLEVLGQPGADRVVEYRAYDDGRGVVQAVAIDGVSMTLKERGDGWSNWYASFPTGHRAILAITHKR